LASRIGVTFFSFHFEGEESNETAVEEEKMHRGND
jgi:hypothetical protein